MTPASNKAQGASGQYLTKEQVWALNEKHGWFASADAQGDVSRAFAQDAIEMHERMRRAAPQLLTALAKCIEALSYYDNNLNTECQSGVDINAQVVLDAQRFGGAAIAAATQGEGCVSWME